MLSLRLWAPTAGPPSADLGDGDQDQSSDSDQEQDGGRSAVELLSGGGNVLANIANQKSKAEEDEEDMCAEHMK
jgi:hypothetical protein